MQFLQFTEYSNLYDSKQLPDDLVEFLSEVNSMTSQKSVYVKWNKNKILPVIKRLFKKNRAEDLLKTKFANESQGQ